MATAAQLDEAVGRLEKLVAAIREPQWQLPTPCPEWSVRALVSHVVVGNRAFAAALGGEAAGGAIPADPGDLGDDPVAAYRDAGAAVIAAFREPDALERVVTVPFGTVPGTVALHLRLTELLVHGWDLARATGIEVGFPGGLAEQELEFTRGALAGVPPTRSPFGPPQPVPPGAAAIDQLAGLLGRSVTADG